MPGLKLLLNFKSTIGTLAFNEQKVASPSFSASRWPEYPKFILNTAIEDFDMEELCSQLRKPGINRKMKMIFLKNRIWFAMFVSQDFRIAI